MYIKTLKIDNYNILNNIKMNFVAPQDNKNSVNVIAGVNGSGKTTLLNWILKKFQDTISSNDNDDLIIYDKEEISSRVIYIPSNMTFNYQSQSAINTSYKFINRIDSDNLLGNAEFFIKEYILTQERLSSTSNPKQRTIDAVNKFNTIFKESQFITRLVDLDIDNQNRPIFETISGDKITIDKLSSGEQQLYARVVSLMILNPQNSVILIDEPELALHPKWQIEIMKIYSNIGINNQFIVTTHSPFIISQTPHKSLIFLLNEGNKIVVKQFSEAPLDRDINTIVKTIMGTDYLPKELAQLHNRYRKLFEEHQLDSDEAKILKKQILEYESLNSSFFQQIEFDKVFME